MSRHIKFSIHMILGGLLAAALAFCILHLTGKLPMRFVDGAINRMSVKLTSLSGSRSSEPVVIGQWPPIKGTEYPDLILSDQNGDTVRLKDLAGKVILLELAAIPCKGCQAFAGGQQYGGFSGVRVQKGLESIHRYAERISKVKLGSDKNVVFVQLLLYGKSMSCPSQDEVNLWAKHFRMERTANTIVLRGDASMLGTETYNRIPGFHLIDENFVLKYDSSGHRPKDDLYRDLLPAMGRMARQSNIGRRHGSRNESGDQLRPPQLRDNPHFAQ